MPSILQGRDRQAARPAPQHESGAAPPQHMGGEASSHLISHGDGTHSIQHEDGSQTDHPHIGHALMALAGKHSDGMHYHVHHDGMGGGHTVHTSEHGGEPEGPHDHENLESVKHGLDTFFGEEEKEYGGDMDGKKESPSEPKDYD